MSSSHQPDRFRSLPPSRFGIALAKRGAPRAAPARVSAHRSRFRSATKEAARLISTAVAEHCRLSPNESISSPRSAQYQVRAASGFTPGFPYLGGLPQRIGNAAPGDSAHPRACRLGRDRWQRRPGSIPLPPRAAGTLSDGTPLRLFDPRRKPPALLRNR